MAEKVVLLIDVQVFLAVDSFDLNATMMRLEGSDVERAQAFQLQAKFEETYL